MQLTPICKFMSAPNSPKAPKDATISTHQYIQYIQFLCVEKKQKPFSFSSFLVTLELWLLGFLSLLFTWLWHHLLVNLGYNMPTEFVEIFIYIVNQKYNIP